MKKGSRCGITSAQAYDESESCHYDATEKALVFWRGRGRRSRIKSARVKEGRKGLRNLTKISFLIYTKNVQSLNEHDNHCNKV